MKIRTRVQLANVVNRGKKVKYVFFWGQKRKGETLTKSCFSQWFSSPFIEGDTHFATAEHYMMYSKAKLFGDADAMQEVLDAKNPGAAKAIGRSVRGFDQGIWNTHKFDLVVQANLAKFVSSNELKAYLLSTGERVLVEASPVDRVWGIGLAEEDKRAMNPNLWKGENLLGFALMEVRDRLINTEVVSL